MVIPLNRVYCKHPIYHKTSYNKSGGESKFPKEDEKILPPAELLADYFKKRKALDHEISFHVISTWVQRYNFNFEFRHPKDTKRKGSCKHLHKRLQLPSL